MSGSPNLAKCPKCGQTVPDWAQVCQFCGTLIPGRAPIRPVGGGTAAKPAGRWQDLAYIIASIWWIGQGLRILLAGAQLVRPEVAGGGGFLASFGVLAIIIGGFLTLVGIGMVARVELARGAANIICWIQIAFAALGIFNSLMAIALLGPLGLLWMFLEVFDMASSIFLVYLIGETDRPNSLR